MLRHKVHALGFNRASLRFIFAGGEGGSITILCNSLSRAKRAMIREIEQENPLFKNIPIYEPAWPACLGVRSERRILNRYVLARITSMPSLPNSNRWSAGNALSVINLLTSVAGPICITDSRPMTV